MDRVGKIYYRSNVRGGEAVMIINSLDGQTYYRDILGINNGDNFVLYVDDDISIDELEHLFINNTYTIIDINDTSDKIKQKTINCLFKSNIKYRS